MSDDLERRMAAIEDEQVHLRREAAAARALAAGADRDVADLTGVVRANTRMLNVLRETQVEQGEAITGLRAEMRAGLAHIVRLLEGLAPNDAPGGRQE